MNSKMIKVAAVAAGFGALGFVAAYAQQNVSNQYPGKIPPEVHATTKDPVGAPPDPTHIPFTIPKDVKWEWLTPGQGQIAKLYGDPSKPGPYAVLYKWYPGAFSRPHFHDKIRHIYVVSGTWWVSSSTVYDEKKTFPFHAGTVATDERNAIHWDGARSGEKEPAVILLAGEGPVQTIFVDTKGKPIPPATKK